MNDISHYQPLSAKVTDKDLLSEEDVEKILNTLEPFYRERLVRHMMAAEKKAYEDGRKHG